MSGGTGSGLFPMPRLFSDAPDVRLRILCLPLGEGAAIGRPRLPLLTKGGAPRSELEY